MTNKLFLRPEKEIDYPYISAIHIDNFKHDLEAKLIENLRKLPTFHDYFSQVLCLEDKVIGHLMITPVTIETCRKSIDALVIGPVSISKDYQGKGYGTFMINECFEILKEKGYDIILVYGGDYYKRFGFKSAKHVHRPNPVIGHGILIKRLSHKHNRIEGVIHYPHPFNSLINEWSK